MLSISFESAERGDSVNWVKPLLLERGFDLIAFEGYTVKDSGVSLLLDRGCSSTPFGNFHASELFDYLKKQPEFKLGEKIRFARQLNCPFYFFCYSYQNENCALFELSDEAAGPIQYFSGFKDFAKWTMGYRDLVMKSAYEEKGLPRIDVALRKAGIPWPGNLDDVLLKNQKPTAIIEFQRTETVSVRTHSNNRWFLPSRNRKGDVNRWRVLDIIRKQSGLPLFIIVWSRKEKIVRLKLVEEIVYPEDRDPRKGLRYRNKEVMNIDRLIEVLNRY